MDKSIHSAEYAVFLQLLKKTRLEKHITQVGLAERLKATQTFVSKCERGERRLDVVELQKWCEALGVSLPEFVQKMADKQNSTLTS